MAIEPKKRKGKALNWSSEEKDDLAKITQKKINQAAKRWQKPQPVVTKEDAEAMPGLIVTDKVSRPDRWTNLISPPKVTDG